MLRIFIGKVDDSFVIVALYVDDGLILSENKKSIQHLKQKISSNFEITSGPPSCYVGLEIERLGETGPIIISQANYVQNLLTRFNMLDCNPVKVPLQPYKAS